MSQLHTAARSSIQKARAHIAELNSRIFHKIIDKEPEKNLVKDVGIRCWTYIKKTTPKWRSIHQNNFIWYKFFTIDCVSHPIALILQPYYYLKWEGYTNRHNTWEPIENLTGCAELLAQFEISRATNVLGVARRNAEIVTWQTVWAIFSFVFNFVMESLLYQPKKSQKSGWTKHWTF